MRSLRDDLDGVLLTEVADPAAARRTGGRVAARLCRQRVDAGCRCVDSVSGLFIADLLRRLPDALAPGCLGVAQLSMAGNPGHRASWVLTKALQLDVRDRDVLVVRRILDTVGPW